MITLHNTLTQQKEPFEPISAGVVKMYHCGPTVYNFAHIGNLRAYVFADLLRRVFEFAGYQVKQVINITDIGHLTSDADEGDDKMVKGLKREGFPLSIEGLSSLATKYEEAFKNDLAEMNIRTPHYFPRATGSLPEEIALVETLQEKGFTYTTKDGIYFDTEKFPHYGKLGGLTPLNEQRERVGSDDKKSPRDFVLWKFSSSNKIGFSSPWGFGFPGWHIECSAMARQFLGQPFDIHTGGMDHIPVHHNNEIAQSEAAYDVPLANYWLHGAFLNISDEKMAKSGENFLTLKVLKNKGFSPLEYRYFLLGGHYKTPLSYSDEAVKASSNALKRLVSIFSSWDDGGVVNHGYKQKFFDYIYDDLNTPQALALAWELTKDSAIPNADKKATFLEFDAVFGLGLETLSEHLKSKSETIPDEVIKLLAEREVARRAGDFKQSDELRSKIHKLGFIVEDSSNGPSVSAS